MSILDSAKKAAIGKALELALKHAKKDPINGLMDIVSLAENYIPVKNGKAGFDQAREIFSNPNSKWSLYANSILQDVDTNILKALILNGAYEVAYKGRELASKAKLEQKVNIPLTILMEQTSDCNLCCVGCSSEGNDASQNLSFEEMDSLISQGKKLGIYFYQFTGGEPLSRKSDILKLCMKHSDCVFHIFTNGTFMDKQLCADLREAGNIFLSIGIYGREPLCDMSRGTGSFSKAVSAMALSHEAGLMFGACVCCTSRNVLDATSDDFFDMLIGKGCKYCLYLQYMPVGNEALPELMLSPGQRETLFQRVKSIRSPECTKSIVAADFQDDEHFLGGCVGGGRGFMHIRSNGYAEPCLFLHYSNANIRKMSLIGLLRQPLFTEFAKRQPFGGNLLCSCPLLDAPNTLIEMVKSSRAKSTSLIDPEPITQLCEKCRLSSESGKDTSERLQSEL